MSVPETPYTRKEMYLDAIARGDSSGIPERPYTREEKYLDAIAKSGGGGGGGDFDAIVHYSQSYDSSEPPEITIERGNFATLYQMLENGRMPTFLITYSNPIVSLYWSAATVCIYNFDSECIYIVGRVPNNNNSAYWPAFGFLWNNDDTITWY